MFKVGTLCKCLTNIPVWVNDHSLADERSYQLPKGSIFSIIETNHSWFFIQTHMGVCYLSKYWSGARNIEEVV